MATATTENRCNGAVHQCLAECYEADNRLACLAMFVAQLRLEHWSETEIEEVETVVRRMLTAVIHPSVEP